MMMMMMMVFISDTYFKKKDGKRKKTFKKCSCPGVLHSCNLTPLKKTKNRWICCTRQACSLKEAGIHIQLKPRCCGIQPQSKAKP